MLILSIYHGYNNILVFYSANGINFRNYNSNRARNIFKGSEEKLQIINQGKNEKVFPNQKPHLLRR